MEKAKKQPLTEQTAEEIKRLREMLNDKEEQLNKKEVLLNEREKLLNAKEQQLNEKNKSEQDYKATKKAGLSFTFRNEKYKFLDDAPQSIRFGGLVYTQKELSENEDALVQLIGGNSVLIEKI